MKLGPLEVKLADREPVGRPSPRRGEIGSTGTQVFNDVLTADEYNPDLMGTLRYDVYDKMRKSDGQVRAGLMVVKLPLLRAEWSIKPASDSAEDKRIADFLSEDLFTTMDIPWTRFLRQALTMLDYGSMLFEEVWTLKEGKIHLKKLAPRLPKSIIEWKVTNNGMFGGVKQGAMRGGNWNEVDIPAEKLLLFVNELEGSDYRGVSLLRAAYKHYYYKDGFYRVDAIAKERRAVGVDVGTLYGPVDEDRRKDLEAAMMTLHAHEKQFFTEIDGEHTYRIEGITGAIADCLASIEHHDVRILRSILAEFLSMGERSGSQAMHRDKTSFFMMALGAIADDLVDVINNDLIIPWVDWNFSGVTKYPKLQHSRLETRDTQAIASAIARLVNVGAMVADEDTENRVREMLDLPKLPPGTPRPEPLAKVTPGPWNDATGKGQPGRNGNGSATAQNDRGSQRQKVAARLARVGRDIAEKNQWGRTGDVNIPYKEALLSEIEQAFHRAMIEQKISIDRGGYYDEAAVYESILDSQF